MASTSQTTREIVIDLEREGPQRPWGIRLVGGSDMNLPLIITQVISEQRITQHETPKNILLLKCIKSAKTDRSLQSDGQFVDQFK